MNSSTINITEVISNSINTLFNNLFSSIDNNTYLILDEITFINPDIFNDTFLQKIFGTNCYSGILLVCNSLLIGFIIFYGIHLLSTIEGTLARLTSSSGDILSIAAMATTTPATGESGLAMVEA